MRGVISIVYDLSTAMFPASELGHCTKGGWRVKCVNKEKKLKDDEG